MINFISSLQIIQQPMMTNINSYFERLVQEVYDTISTAINENAIYNIVVKDIYKSHVEEPNSARFQQYYFRTINNETKYLSSTNFFREFKTKYALQGIDNDFLDQLEGNKKEILILIRENKLSQLYFNVFFKAKVKYKDSYKEKDLGSFFAKLVHTFRPDDYCALDNPIKDYFGLSKESFFFSFFIISKAYKNWATNNQEILNTIKSRFKQLDKHEIIKQDKLTDLKLLDLIFWSKANRKG
jgi:hypothetical protein